MLTLEIQSELMKKLKKCPNALSIFRKSLTATYRAYRAKLICEKEYQKEYANLLYKCSLIAE